MTRIKILIIALCALILGLALLPATLHAGGYGERISNGSFEEGFGYEGVALNWKSFNNGGRALYGYQDDTDHLLVFDGKHSQLVEINTLHNNQTDPERISGIYQTVSVVAGQPYTLTVRGMIRLMEYDLDRSNFSYVVQWGMDSTGSGDWRKVTEWNTLPWQTTYLQTKPGAFLDFATTLTPTSNKITLFFIARKKFAVPNKLLDVNFDGISLFGQLPPDTGAPKLAVVPPTYVYTTKPFPVRVTTTDGIGVSDLKLYDNDILVTTEKHVAGPLQKDIDLVWTPTITGTRTLKVVATNQVGKTTTITKTVEVVPIAEFLKNGNFENGFLPSGIALNWGTFSNGGRNLIDAFYDDTWTPVVFDGAHAQLIEIWNLDYPEGDPLQEPDRYAGICQVVNGLTPGASYYLNANGTVRISATETVTTTLTDWSYSAQWGYLPGASADCAAWTRVNNWQTLPWKTEYRDKPTKINNFSAQIFAPGDSVTLFFRAWKKWPQGRREFLVNLDGLSFAGYKPLPPPVTPTPTITPTATITATVTPTATISTLPSK
ncbi:hypothetical protein ANRL1_03092 [Anaerolineae bacterium]|nr:hypothetical protein ANRL1_03092 [Anaerolineae bacterium]